MPGTSVRLPKEHGAWSMLAASFLLGGGAAGAWPPAVWLLLTAALAGFIGREHLRAPIGVGLGLLAVGLWAWLLIAERRVALAPLGTCAAALWMASLRMQQRRNAHTLLGEVVGIIGLSLLAPAAEYTASGTWSARTSAVWILCLGFFLGSVFHVRLLVRKRAQRTRDLAARLTAGWPSAAYHLGLGYCVWLLPERMPGVPSAALMVFLPMIAKALWAIPQRAKSPLSIRRIGLTELAHTVVFVALLVAMYRL